MSEVKTITQEWRKRWSHKPTPIPPDATGLWYSEECVDQMLADFSAALQRENERLKEEIELMRSYRYSSDHALNNAIIESREDAAKLEAAEQRIRDLEEALQTFPQFPTECAHDEETWYCDSCKYWWENAVRQWSERRIAALTPSKEHDHGVL